MIPDSSHESVLLDEVIKVLAPKSGEFFIDGTLDGGGHARAILEKISPEGTLLGVDWDAAMIKKFSEPAGKNKIILINDNYKNITMILEQKNLGKVDGVLLDLGFSSEQLASDRGFSFQKNDPLLMTYDKNSKPAYLWLQDLKEKDLAKIIKDLGEEKFAETIARNIKKSLPIKTTNQLVTAIRAAVPKFYERGRLNPATRTFQALRIFVNQELENLRVFLGNAESVLNPGGRLAVISFHSLEDRIVKENFRALVADKKADFINKKPIVPSREEIYENPRSRSAKLRAIKFI